MPTKTKSYKTYSYTCIDKIYKYVSTCRQNTYSNYQTIYVTYIINTL
jgi:hypothetical protein